nr:TIGR01620 family protein [uncultured Roseovarius sp.]
MSKGPVLFDIEAEEARKAPANPAEAPPVPEADLSGTATPDGRAMQTIAALAAGRPSRLARLFWSLLLTLLGVVVSIAAWDFVNNLIARMPLVGYAVTVLVAIFLLVVIAIALREISAFSRLRRIDTLHRAADTALADNDLAGARKVVEGLNQLYAAREDTAWGRERLQERQADQLDATTLLALAEAELLAPLDAAAKKEVEAAARQVATVTAIVPLALADVFVALSSNLRMIRRVAEIYGGRSGTLGSWRLTRVVLSHLVATGAIAVGDDLIGSVAGGTLLSKLSRRFGEGIVNGALTARVGVSAMEVCRPLPFSKGKRPSVSRLVGRALAGFLPRSGG